MPRLIRPALAALLLGACAHMATPPGGPVDHTPPYLLSVYPDSVRVLEGFKGDVEFRFNEVVSEGAQPNFGLGTGDFEKLILLSPDTLVPHVEWRRNRITVRPHAGWKPNTVYRIELLPGVRDLTNNEMKASRLITFATGGPPPTRSLLGRAIDWPSQRSIAMALIQATHLPDQAVYRTVSDSFGYFHLEALPAGEYLVAAVIDKNRNYRRERDESWDTVRVAAGTTELPELWVFPRDSAVPRASKAERIDTTWAALTLSQPVRTDLFLPGDSVRVLHLPDSTSIGPLYAVSESRFDSLHPKLVAAPARKDSTTRRDSIAAGDSVKASVAPPPLPKPVTPATDSVRHDAPGEKRPVLTNRLFVHTSGPFVAGERYWIEVKGMAAQGGATGQVGYMLILPEVKPPVAAKSDSSKAKPDTAKAKGVGGGGLRR